MNRKKFIEQCAWSAAALALFPQLLASCKKEKLFGDSNFIGEVIIIGAGAAGLYAAYLLNLQGISVKILEASDRSGGRIKTLNNFSDFPIELGAEIIHGERSIWHDLVIASGGQFINSALNKLYYFNGTLMTEIEATQNTFFNVMTGMVGGVEEYSGGDVTVEAYGNIEGLNQNVAHIFNAMMANVHGTSASRIGMYGLRESLEKWTAGNADFMLKDRSLMSVIEDQFDDVLQKVVYNTRIVSLDYSGGKILMHDENDVLYETDRVILTVPISVLKDGDISFTPELPANKVAALNKIGFDRTIKIILKFDERVWPSNTGSIYGNGYVPQYWPTAAGGRSTTDNVLTGFVSGEKAEQLAALGADIIPTLLIELDNLLGDASSHYVDHVIQDWGDEPFIRGGFSYAVPGTGSARETIALPIAGKIFFAGEATHTDGHHATVHGAMETGLRAVSEILGS